MKKIISILFFLYSTIIFGQVMNMPQVPQGITYQAIALNNAGNQLINSNIKLRLSIIDNSATGTVLYTETHAKTTNDKGLYSLVIGQGTVVTGTFAGIDWGKNIKFLKVEMDATGGTNYTIVGSTQMQSVPYALYSGKTASIAGNISINDEIVENKNGNFAFEGSNGIVYVYNANLNLWSSQIGSVDTFQFFSTSLMASNENFAFAGDNGIVYVYNAKINAWSSQIGRLYTYGSLGIVQMVGSNGNFAFAGDNGIVYVYNAKLNIWNSQIGTIVNQTGIGITTHIIYSKGNFAFAGDNGIVYVYNSRLNLWSSQIGQINYSQSIQSFEGNGNFSFAGTNGIVYVYNEKNNVWSSQIGSLTSGTQIVTSPSN
jgi:hypothetical protein